MVKSMSLAAKVPHFHYLEEINCDSLVQLKTRFQNENKDNTIKHTFLPFLIKSLSMALSKYPMLNSSFIEETNEVVLKGMESLSSSFCSCFLSPRKTPEHNSDSELQKSPITNWCILTFHQLGIQLLHKKRTICKALNCTL